MAPAIYARGINELAGFHFPQTEGWIRQCFWTPPKRQGRFCLFSKYLPTLLRKWSQIYFESHDTGSRSPKIFDDFGIVPVIGLEKNMFCSAKIEPRNKKGIIKE